uniref:Zinc knuckle CX2CX4HX4C domain-containing protein n=1 Tax=Cannabis sativa TaxID=3483 RepID=A0A803PAD7_CANSA
MEEEENMATITIDDEEEAVNFKYDVPTICFICGIMGHSNRFCPRRFDVLDGKIIKPYGEWMRVKPICKNHTIRAKWLKQFMVAMEDDPVDDANTAVGFEHRSLARKELVPGGGIKIPMIVEENMGQRAG